MNEKLLTNRSESSDAVAAEREGILEAMRCVVGSEGALYVSTPITGGLRFVAWYDAEGWRLRGQQQYDTQRLANVITPNCVDAAAFAEALRHTTGKVVIDPSRFFLNHWTQSAYHALWCEIVRRFVSGVHFNEGWWTSVGCAQELLAAVERGIPLYEGLGNELSPEAGLRRLREGVEKLRAINLACNDLAAAAVGELEELLRKDLSHG